MELVDSSDDQISKTILGLILRGIGFVGKEGWARDDLAVAFENLFAFSSFQIPHKTIFVLP